MLVEELWGCIDVVVCSRIGSANDHDGQTTGGGGRGVVDAIVVDGWLEEVGVVFEPVKQLERSCTERICILCTI